MKAISLWQPWASLIAVGAKTIETRSWQTSYRGPIAIHAAKRRPPTYHHHNVNDDLPPAYDLVAMSSCWEWTEHPDDFYSGGAYRWVGPLGAVIATATLADVIPISDRWGAAHQHGRALLFRDHRIFGGDTDGLWRVSSDGGRGVVDGYAEAQLPYGDFTNGRWAWLLNDISPLADPIPVRGRQQLFEWAS